MFWDKPLYYSEYPDQPVPPLDHQYPATMVFESSVCKPEDHVEKLFDLPFIKAAGVAVIIIAYTEAEEMQYTLSANSYLGRGYMETYLEGVIRVGALQHWMEGTALNVVWDKINTYASEDGPVMEAVELDDSTEGTDILLSSSPVYSTRP